MLGQQILESDWFQRTEYLRSMLETRKNAKMDDKISRRYGLVEKVIGLVLVYAKTFSGVLLFYCGLGIGTNVEDTISSREVCVVGSIACDLPTVFG